jgi:HAMP domain-containing protein
MAQAPPLRLARLPLWRRIAWRLGTGFVLLTALGILLSGYLQYRARDQELRRTLGSLLLNIARTGTLLVDGEMHERVVQSGRNDAPEYSTLRDRLRKIQETNGLTDPVYTLSHVQDERARFAVISHGGEPVGKEYRLAPAIRPILTRVLAEGKAAYTDIYVNEHGSWMTAFAPIFNRAGETVAALDVDFRADVYLAELDGVRWSLYVHSFVGALLAMAAGLFAARRITRPVAEISALARSVVKGDLTARAHITARDEIGLLGNVFHLMVERLHVSHRSVVDVLVRVLEAKEGRPGSLQRLANATLVLADRLELSPAQREALELGALLHTIGEIGIPEALLRKTEPLTPDEQRLVEQHPVTGVEILEKVPLLTPALDVVAGHHERYDGRGYPQGLSGEEIPYAARVFAVVDALHTLVHGGPDGPPCSVEEALNSVRAKAGRRLDPRVVEAALKIAPAEWARLLHHDVGS